MATLATLATKLTLIDDLTANLDKVSGNVESSMSRMGKVVAIGFAAAGAATVALGGMAFNAASQYDDALDTIRIGTGATGDALTALGEEARDVWTAIPTTLDMAATAIADLNTRTGLTGDALGELAKQEIELARLTGGDLSSQIANTTRLFGDWGVSTADQASTLDMLWRASQSTGIGIDELSSKTVQYGSPLRQLGFSLGETIAMLGSFEKAGVNTELVMGSLRIATGKLAAEGVQDMGQGFADIVGKIKSATTAAEGISIASEYFGARAGPDMAAAIREGRLEFDDLLAVIEDGDETILEAAADTNDWAESWQILKNNIQDLLIPLGTVLFTLLTNGMNVATRNVQRFSKWINGAVRVTYLFEKRLGKKGVAAAISTLGIVLENVTGINLSDWFDRMGNAAQRPINAFQKIFDSFGERNWRRFAAGIGDAISSIPKAIGDALLGIDTRFKSVNKILTQAGRAWIDFGRLLQEIGQGDLDGFLTVLDRLIGRLGNIGGQAIDLAISIGAGAISAGADLLGWVADNLDTIAGWLKSGWDGAVKIGGMAIGAVVDGAKDLKGWISSNISMVTGWIRSGWDGTLAIGSAIIDATVDGASDLKGWINTNKSMVIGWIRSGWDGALAIGSAAIDAVVDGASDLKGWISANLDTVKGWITSGWDGTVTGIGAALSFIASYVSTTWGEYGDDVIAAGEWLKSKIGDIATTGIVAIISAVDPKWSPGADVSFTDAIDALVKQTASSKTYEIPVSTYLKISGLSYDVGEVINNIFSQLAKIPTFLGMGPIGMLTALEAWGFKTFGPAMLRAITTGIINIFKGTFGINEETDISSVVSNWLQGLVRKVFDKLITGPTIDYAIIGSWAEGFVKGIAAQIRDKIRSILDSVEDPFGAIRDKVNEWIGGIFTGDIFGPNGSQDPARGYVEGGSGDLSGAIIGWLQSQISNVVTAITTKAGEWWDSITGAIDGIFPDSIDMSMFTNPFTGMKDAILAWVKDQIPTKDDILAVVPQDLKDFYNDPFGTLQGWLGLGGDGDGTANYPQTGGPLPNPFMGGGKLDTAIDDFASGGSWKLPPLDLTEFTASIEPIPTLLGTKMDEALQLSSTVATGIQTALTAQFTATTTAIGTAVEPIPTIVKTALDRANQAGTAAANSLYVSVSTFFGMMVGNVTGIVNTLPGIVVGAMNSVASQGASAALNAGASISYALANGIWMGIPAVTAAADALAAEAERAANARLERASPPRVFVRMGEDVGDAFADSMLSKVGRVSAAGDALGEASIPTTGYGRIPTTGYGPSGTAGTIASGRSGDTYSGTVNQYWDNDKEMWQTQGAVTRSRY